MTEGQVVELSHDIRDGMVTLPGFPEPQIGTYLSREDSRARYAPGTEFFIGTISMIANTGTYLDTPFHRYDDGFDLAGLPPLLRVPGILVRAGDGGIGPEALGGMEVAGMAVLFGTGWDRHFERPEYAVGHPFITGETADRLVAGGARLVGIDSVNIDDTNDPSRPAHSILLRAGIPILEHLTRLDQLPDRGFEVTALPPKVEGFGTFPVRVVAEITS
jgi:arylformamidase